MRGCLVALLLATVILGAVPAGAQPRPSVQCPSRGSMVDAMKNSLILNDILLIVQSGGTVALAHSYWGRPAAVATAVVNGLFMAFLGNAAVDESFDALRPTIPQVAARSGQSVETVQAKVDTIHELVGNNWLMRVAGATVGGLAGLFTQVAWGPIFATGPRVLLGTAAGSYLGGQWHRQAFWPFVDTAAESCSIYGRGG